MSAAAWRRPCAPSPAGTIRISTRKAISPRSSHSRTARSRSLGFNGYGYFDITELTWLIGEGGQQAKTDPRLKKPKPRRTGATGQDEKTDYILSGDQAHARNFAERKMPFFGLTS